MKKRNPMTEAVLFTILTLGLSYFVFWGPIAFFQVPTISFVDKTRGPLWAIILFITGGFIPSLAALLLVRLFEGQQGFKRFLKRTSQFNIGWRWYLAIALVVALGAFGQIMISRLLGNNFKFSLYLSQLPIFLPLILLGPLSEEYGWRGYLLTKLQQKWSALASSVTVGVIWTLWHLPLFFMIGTSQYELRIPFIGFLVGIVSVSVLMTWINNNTRNSLWAAILFHWLYTYTLQVNSTGITLSGLYNWLGYLPYVIMALAVIIIWGPKNLHGRRGKQTGSYADQLQQHASNPVKNQ
jgi:membrane protease YdiL (CAAX protease family)